jgi:pimeloyl-ACP methyl ester carboxylesterase
MVGEIRKLPRELWPVIQSYWCDPKSFEGMARYLEALPESAAAVGAEIARARTLGDIPLTILSAGNASPAQRAGQEELAGLSRRGRLEVVSDSGHWIQLNRPDLVVRSIAEMVALVRRP